MKKLFMVAVCTAMGTESSCIHWTAVAKMKVNTSASFSLSPHVALLAKSSIILAKKDAEICAFAHPLTSE